MRAFYAARMRQPVQGMMRCNGSETIAIMKSASLPSLRFATGWKTTATQLPSGSDARVDGPQPKHEPMLAPEVHQPLSLIHISEPTRPY